MEWTVTNAAGSVDFSAAHTPPHSAHPLHPVHSGHTTHRTRSQDEHCVARLGRAWLPRLMSTRVSNPFSYTVSKLNIYISYANGMWVVLRVSSTV